MNQRKKNFLDYIPSHNRLFSYEENGRGNVEILRKNRGFFNRLAQLLLKKPRVSRIELDDFGSFIWRHIDGQRDVYQLGKLVREEFGQKAEPLYERLTEFLHILRSNDFIVYENLKKK